ncbi:13360_t:CDS:2 [Ambispora gerdemannii]|uniref:13360_t:CDS:1 n=1 Tax=Ambispora gerdemannii TaxID=144530 RepID=A0A9N8WPU5_9GLOM|nr:13360_t:CDS:2 [Ambispora gerdemannii]
MKSYRHTDLATKVEPEHSDNNGNVDVIIIVGQYPNIERFSACSKTLRERSIYFNTALSSRWAKKEKSGYLLEKPNLLPEVFRLILEFLVHRKVMLRNYNGTMINLLLAAEELMLGDLRNVLQSTTTTHKTRWMSENCPDLLRVVLEFESLKKLRHTVLGWICENPSWLYDSDNFMTLEESIILTMIKNEKDYLNNSFVWDILLRWSIARNNTISLDTSTWSVVVFEVLKNNLKEFLPYIRFDLISRNDFHDKIIPLRKIISRKITDQTLRYYLEDNQQYPPKTILDDSLVINHIHAATISKWIMGKNINSTKSLKYESQFKHRFTKRHEFKLIYRGSRDGFSGNAYHRHCDNNGKNLVVAKIANSNIIVGGYNPLDTNVLDNIYEYRYSTKSFLFTFGTTDVTTPSRINSADNHFTAIRSTYNGPCFGTRDLYFNLNHRSGVYDSEIYTGSILDRHNFEIFELEVFKVLKI